MTDIVDDAQFTYAEKIDKLLRKAEGASTPEEAEVYTSMAQKLMAKYAISEQILAAARGLTAPDEIVEESIKFTGIYKSALFDLGSAVGRNNGCKVLITTDTWTYKRDENGRSVRDCKATLCHLVGYKSDVERVKLLTASVQLQCMTGMQSWWKAEDRSWMSKMDAYKARREFILGFAQGLSSKLAEARRAGQAEAVKDHAAATGQDESAVRESTALVLRSRQEQVKDWYDNRYGKITRTVRRNYQSGGASARGAGYTAGRSANTGTTGLGSSRGAIGGR